MTPADLVGTLYSAHFSDAVRLAYLLTADHSAAEDIAQDAFIKVAGRLRQIRDPSRFGAYLRRTVVRTSIDRARGEQRRATRQIRAAGTPSPVDNPMMSTEHLDIAHAVDALPPRQRAIVVLRYWADLPVPEIARALGCPQGTVKSGLSRALETLRKGITAHE